MDYAGDDVHIEHTTIPGARPITMMQAYEACYGQISIPQDVVISGKPASDTEGPRIK